MESLVGLIEPVNIPTTEEAMMVDKEEVDDHDYEVRDDEEDDDEDEEYEYEEDFEAEDINVLAEDHDKEDDNIDFPLGDVMILE